MAKRTPEDVCIEYAIAVAAVRAQTRILRDNRCPDESIGERDEASGYMHGVGISKRDLRPITQSGQNSLTTTCAMPARCD
jgi:hypothetical protein